MKKLVVYYSRTGTTKKLAEKISQILKADIEGIKDKQDRSGALGYLKAGKDAIMNRLTKIKYRKNPEKYSLVVVGTPIWVWDVSPAIRTYLSENKNKIRKIAFFCTMKNNGSENTFKHMQHISKNPIATLALTTKEAIDNNCTKIKSFTKKLK